MQNKLHRQEFSFSAKAVGEFSAWQHRINHSGLEPFTFHLISRGPFVLAGKAGKVSKSHVGNMLRNIGFSKGKHARKLEKHFIIGFKSTERTQFTVNFKTIRFHLDKPFQCSKLENFYYLPYRSLKISAWPMLYPRYSHSVFKLKTDIDFRFKL